MAEYTCVKPANAYKKMFAHLAEQALIATEVSEYWIVIADEHAICSLYNKEAGSARHSSEPSSCSLQARLLSHVQVYHTTQQKVMKHA